jgi:hypothetical protein
MVDIPLLAITIASAVLLIVVSPRQTRQKALCALRECDEVESVHTSDPERVVNNGPNAEACRVCVRTSIRN